MPVIDAISHRVFAVRQDWLTSGRTKPDIFAGSAEDDEVLREYCEADPFRRDLPPWSGRLFGMTCQIVPPEADA